MRDVTQYDNERKQEAVAHEDETIHEFPLELGYQVQ
jgi:hypothetical protein